MYPSCDKCIINCMKIRLQLALPLNFSRSKFSVIDALDTLAETLSIIIVNYSVNFHSAKYKSGTHFSVSRTFFQIVMLKDQIMFQLEIFYPTITLSILYGSFQSYTSLKCKTWIRICSHSIMLAPAHIFIQKSKFTFINTNIALVGQQSAQIPLRVF